jgi:hypothetical protein
MSRVGQLKENYNNLLYNYVWRSSHVTNVNQLVITIYKKCKENYNNL